MRDIVLAMLPRRATASSSRSPAWHSQHSLVGALGSGARRDKLAHISGRFRRGSGPSSLPATCHGRNSSRQRRVRPLRASTCRRSSLFLVHLNPGDLGQRVMCPRCGSRQLRENSRAPRLMQPIEIGQIVLGDYPGEFVVLACAGCRPRGEYRVATLLAMFGGHDDRDRGQEGRRGEVRH